MNKAMAIFAVLFLLAAILFAWILRIEARPISDNSFAITDHWTGHVYLCAIRSGCQQIYP